MLICVVSRLFVFVCKWSVWKYVFVLMIVLMVGFNFGMVVVVVIGSNSKNVCVRNVVMVIKVIGVVCVGVDIYCCCILYFGI